jgi:hypothetical protein
MTPGARGGLAAGNLADPTGFGAGADFFSDEPPAAPSRGWSPADLAGNPKKGERRRAIKPVPARARKAAAKAAAAKAAKAAAKAAAARGLHAGLQGAAAGGILAGLGAGQDALQRRGALQESPQVRKKVGPEVGPTSAFYTCIPTGMRGAACIFWASLTPPSLQGSRPGSPQDEAPRHAPPPRPAHQLRPNAKMKAKPEQVMPGVFSTRHTRLYAAYER